MQGLLVLVFFDLRRKIYYMCYEKVMGRPHQAVRAKKMRMINNSSDNSNRGRLIKSMHATYWAVQNDLALGNAYPV